MFGNKFVKIVSNFEIKLFYDCLVTFGFQRSYRKIINTPIVFEITQNEFIMKKIWGFKLERFKVFFQKSFKIISEFLILKLKLFFIVLLHLKFKEVL